LHGAAAGHILRGELADARAYLERSGTSPDARSDLAVVALAQGRLEEALTLLDAVLDAQPKHPQALWNRALVLHELKLDLSAADAFRTVAALGEQGWAEEAKGRAAQLESGLVERKRAWLAAWNAGIALALEGRPVPEGAVRDAPALLRNYLYQSLWSAPSAERARALLPVAKELDAIYGGDRLARYVAWVSARDFKKRGPLASTFAQVVTRYLQAVRAQGSAIELPPSAQPFDPAKGPAFLEAVRRSGETDLLLGALPLLGQLGVALGDYEKAAKALGDPWFTVNVELEKGKADFYRGQVAEAESRLRAALTACAREADYRCAQVEQTIGDLFLVTHRLVEAREHALAGLQQARRLNEPVLQGNFLLLLGNTARFHDAFALARAYLGEYALRQGDFPPAKATLHEALATLHIFGLRPEKARAELERAFQTGAPISIVGAFVLADLARLDPRPDDLERLDKVLEGLKPRLRPGELPLVEHLSGRARITRDRAAGQALLRKAVADAEKLPREDPDAGKARAYSYSTLMLDEGRAGRWAEALGLFGEEADLRVPDRCVLGVEIADEQTLVVAKGASGEAVGAYAQRKDPSVQVERLVPANVLEALRGCERVEVLARNGIHGRPGLLPPELAWSYRTARDPAARPNTPPRQLVVSDVEAPASLNLPRLKAWDAPAVPGRVELSGA
ncbi:MAG TPA: tetratricopeptide repeat protein, partial [Longimicrobium sp.]|nr:tetratricopeptide repeat protein [Longimicrobium sp.]